MLTPPSPPCPDVPRTEDPPGSEPGRAPRKEPEPDFGEQESRLPHSDRRVGNFDFEYLDGQPRWFYYEMPIEAPVAYGLDLSVPKVDVSKRHTGGLGLAAVELGQPWIRVLAS